MDAVCYPARARCSRVSAEWRERLEDLLWHTINQPEWLFIR
jgi:hypothetical protein